MTNNELLYRQLQETHRHNTATENEQKAQRLSNEGNVRYTADRNYDAKIDSTHLKGQYDLGNTALKGVFDAFGNVTKALTLL